jgi:hypothetical protein
VQTTSLVFAQGDINTALKKLLFDIHRKNEEEKKGEF